jgi:hypothetical protein
MRVGMKLAGMSSLMLLGAITAVAQTTNVALVANIALTGFKQVGDSSAVPVRITSKDIIAALNASGHFGFGPGAQLIFLSNDDQLPTVSVRDSAGGATTMTDVSDFFTIDQPAEVDANGNLTSYSIRIFTFDDHNGTSFSVSGLTTMHRGNITSRDIGPLLRVKNSTVQVAGDGNLAGVPVVLHGTITGDSAKAQVD